MAKNNENKIQIRNSANDFLVFSKENGGDGVDVLVADENVWLTQKSICTLYEASKSNVSEHLTAIFASGELGEDSVVRKFRTTASDGKQYTQKYYNLQAIIAVGFKINSKKPSDASVLQDGAKQTALRHPRAYWYHKNQVE